LSGGSKCSYAKAIVGRDHAATKESSKQTFVVGSHVIRTKKKKNQITQFAHN